MQKRTVLPLPGFRWRGLTLQLFVWVVFPLIALLLLVTFGSLYLHQGGMRTMVGERDERAARTAARAISETLNYRAHALQTLSLRAADGHPPQLILYSSTFLSSYFDAGMAFFAPDGELLTYIGNEALWTAPSAAQETEIRKMLADAGSESNFSSVIPSTDGSKPIVLVGVAAAPDTPILVGAFYPTILAEEILVDLFHEDQAGSVYLIPPGGDILFSIRGNPQFTAPLEHPGVREALNGKSGTIYTPTEEGEHVVAYSSVEAVGWALLLEEPWESVSTPLLNTTLFAPLIFIPILLLSLVALWFGARKIIQPLQILEGRARELAWGNFENIEKTVGGIDEIQNLQNALIYLAGKVQAAQNSLRSYIGAITTGQEDERQRLARELHDETIQDLIALNQRIHLMQLDLGRGEHISEQLDELQRMTTETIDDLRRLIRALRPLYLDDLGLVTALDMLARETQGSAGVSIKFHRLGPERRLSPDVNLALYRIAQEGLSNIQRHAAASQAEVKIEYLSDQVILNILDNGVGFDPPESPAEFAPGGHFGLLGIHERAELIGAKLDIKTIPGDGTTVIVTLPLNST